MTLGSRVVLRAVKFGAVRGLLWGGGYGLVFGLPGFQPSVTAISLVAGGACGALGGTVGGLIASQRRTRLWWAISGAVGGAVAGVALILGICLLIGAPIPADWPAWVFFVGVPAVIGAFVLPGGLSVVMG